MNKLLRSSLRTARRFWVTLGIAAVTGAIFFFFPIFAYQPSCIEDGQVQKPRGKMNSYYQAVFLWHVVDLGRPFLMIEDRVFLRFFDWWNPDDRFVEAEQRAAWEVVEFRESTRFGPLPKGRWRMPGEGRGPLGCQRFLSVVADDN